MQSVLPLGASNLLSKSSEIWEQLCSEPSFYSLHFLSSASSSVDWRLSTDFTWQTAASRAQNRKPTLRPSQITCQSESLKFPIAGQTRWSERGCWWVGPRLTLRWWLRLRLSILQLLTASPGRRGNSQSWQVQGCSGRGSIWLPCPRLPGIWAKKWAGGQCQKMLAGGRQGRAKSFHMWEWQGSPYGNYLANHLAVGAERVVTETGGFPRNWHVVRQS